MKKTPSVTPSAEPIPVKAHVINSPGVPRASGGSRSGGSGLGSLVAGSALALVGLPMLILPGPGLLAVGCGVALAARGAKRLFAR